VQNLLDDYKKVEEAFKREKRSPFGRKIKEEVAKGKTTSLKGKDGFRLDGLLQTF
jgi:hypothetical protein